MNHATPGHVRIIGGRLRGSKLPVPDAPGLRPTADRVRETLFNWLQFELAGARVLDLFAGTGALGFEAASRGAALVRLLERDARLAQGLRDSAHRLGADAVQVEAADAMAWLSCPPTEAFDLAFLDPPFTADLWTPCAQRLDPWLAPRAWVYVEAPARLRPALPPDWREHRRGSTREVGFALYQRVPAGTLDPDKARTIDG
ncbi:MAG: 16S rRNA (guanine(966)-N(2))-methyltransferase RsmD [Arenimonas sp.]